MIDDNFVKVREVTESDIQLLRYWRNNPKIQKFMLNQDVISYTDQVRWFKNIDQDHYKHFIYSFNDLDIGTFSIANIDYNKKTFEGGILCGNLDYLKNPINLSVCLYLYQYAFSKLKLETGTARILRSNKTALRLNHAIGYKNLNASTPKVVHCEITKDEYLEKRTKYIDYLGKLNLWPVHFI